MKKLLSLAILLVMLFSLIHTLKAQTSVSNVSVNVNPSYRNTYAEYRITFTINKELKTGVDYIFIQFPKECSIPCTSCAYAHCVGCFKINDTNASGAGTVENYKNAIYLRVPINIPAGNQVEVSISQSANFRNPYLPGKYKIEVWTSQEVEHVASNEFDITSTKISNLTVSVDPEFTNSKTSISINFTTGNLGDIPNGKFIYIKFPSEFTLPQIAKKEFISINSLVPLEAKIDSTKLALQIASSIGRNRNITIKIYPSFGIITPQKKGIYTFSVSTDTEVELVSAQVEIRERDFVTTLIQTDPIEHNGINSFFISPITISLFGETNTQEKVTTFYKINNGEYKLYEKPFNLSEGVYYVSFYSKTDTLTEDVKTSIFKIDLTPAVISLDCNDLTYTAGSTFVISGKISEPSEQSFLFINGLMVNVNNNLSFVKIVPLEIGENKFVIKVTDTAGNKTTKEIKIILDTTIPVLDIETPVNFQEWTKEAISVKGSVSPQNCDVYVNNEKAVVNENGEFNFEYIPKTNNSLLPVNIIAIYPFTKTSVEKKLIVYYMPPPTKIVLTIGKKEITVNNNSYTMDVAPFIDKNSGRTLVPIRFISEFLGFDVGWNEIIKTVTIKNSSKTILLTIGKKTALINGVEYELETPPVIINSRTFVPLRFIGEAFGYKVNWDEKTKSITIIK